jgi:hypothetical protein
MTLLSRFSLTLSLMGSVCITAPAPGIASVGGCQVGWTIVATPFDPLVGSTLNGVGAASTDDVWAVGAFTWVGDGGDPLAMHWDGVAWTEVGTPALEGFVSLGDVAAISSDDVWAVGFQNVSGSETLVEHWNGTEWSAETPEQGSLWAVDAVATDDVWAVGGLSGDPNENLALHFDGRNWRAVDTPNLGSGSNQLNDVSVISADDAWAVGQALSPDTSKSRPVAVHWDGTEWALIRLPRIGGEAQLLGVAAVSSSDVWAVGFSQGDAGPFSLHWNGVLWQRVPTPGSSLHLPTDVAAVATDDVWMVGWHWVAAHTSDTGFAEHWDGSTWKGKELPHDSYRGSTNNYVYDVAAVSATDLWAVGGTNGSPDRPLALHYTEFCGD